MSEQQPLFDPQQAPWVERLWKQLGQARRQQLIRMLAEIAAASVQPTPVRSEKESPNESR